MKSWLLVKTYLKSLDMTKYIIYSGFLTFSVAYLFIFKKYFLYF